MDPTFLVSPLSIAMKLIIVGCTYGAFGNTCDRDAECMQWTKMYACHQRYFGDIHTPAYKEAIRVGHNPGRPSFSVTTK